MFSSCEKKFQLLQEKTNRNIEILKITFFSKKPIFKISISQD